jgi:hypothetical protein
LPVLKNVKHEQFAQLMFEGAKFGWSQGTCYMKAGFRSAGHGAETNASRLLKKADIRRRLAELGGGGAKKARVTAASLIEKLDVVFDGSVAEKQFSAAGRAVEVQGKLAGVMVDKLEVGGPGEFTPTVAETLELVKREFGPVTASAVAWTLDHDDGEMPVDDVARFTLATMSLDRALARHELLREALLRVASDDAQVVEAVPQDDPPDRVHRQALASLTRPTRKMAGDD